ncbi:MAG: FtsX-like permease family protein [Pseudomonadota bacterium]
MTTAELHAPVADTEIAPSRNVFEAGSTAYALRIAVREMRAGLRGFIIFLACIALGVGAVAGVNSVSNAITTGLATEGRAILGGDLKFSLTHLQATDEQRSAMEGLGDVSETATMRTMARVVTRTGGSAPADTVEQTLIELRAVDEAWPLVGAMETEANTEVGALNAPTSDGSWIAVAQPILFERLGIAPGDTVSIGNIEVVLQDELTVEPDTLSTGLRFAPRVLISTAALDAAGLVRVGSLVTWSYALALDDPATVEQSQTQIEGRFPDAGWRVQTTDTASPQLARAVQRFSDFLTLVGLTVLVVGGVGVSNAVRAYLDGQRSVIATLKCLGAPASFITRVYLFQIGLLAGVGTLVGLAIGIAMPVIAGWALEGTLPVAAGGYIFPGALGLAAAFGLLVALVAALLPLGRAQAVPATALFREASGNRTGQAPLPFTVAAFCIAAFVAGVAILTALNQFIATVFVGGLVATFAILWLVAKLVAALARRAPTVRSTPLRLAIGNIHRPGALTSSIALSLGLGLTLLVALTLIENNMRRQLTTGLSVEAPSFFFTDIQNTELASFEQTVTDATPEDSVVTTVPMLRGHVLSLKGIEAEDYPIVDGQGEWVLRGDRGLTYSSDTPVNSTLAAGEWWDENYSGPPLVSFAKEEADELRLAIGDTVSVSVLGRPVTATIANLRDVEWESFGINFVMVFSPNTFAGAPHSHLATLTLPGGLNADDAVARDGEILRTVTAAFPAVTTVRVKDAIDAVNDLIGQIAIAIRAAAALTLVASVLVLAGALSSGSQMRVHDSVVLKTLGATRRTLIAAFATEYGLLGLATAGFALMSGIVAAWFVVVQIMTFDFVISPFLALATIVSALILTIGLGLISTWRILGQKVAPVLREL